MSENKDENKGESEDDLSFKIPSEKKPVIYRPSLYSKIQGHSVSSQRSNFNTFQKKVMMPKNSPGAGVFFANIQQVSFIFLFMHVVLEREPVYFLCKNMQNRIFTYYS
jgi:hypothetical protein